MKYLTTNWPTRRFSTPDLFDEMERFFSDMNIAPSRQEMERGFSPACDVEESEDHFLMMVDLPGIKKEDIKIEMHENILTISGQRQRTKKTDAAEKAQCFERSYGAFARSFTLPSTVASEKIEAQHEDGVLHLCLPKTPIAKSRKIEIQAKSGRFLDHALPGKEEISQKPASH